MVEAKRRIRPPYSGKYEVLGDVELSPEEAAEAERQIAQAEADFAEKAD